ncbi:glutamate receptor 3.3 isoform X1 [Cryptomeria japonica]|uniref:glutamate receptor 3.3 isoform X1 n=2 Tax=Cryptomeria japonica TaxID=3369 RepID=UPI0027DAA4D6|nr:glutamate receptor 3.3 isoform X1 [Cryptomeria japonica]XP_057850923.2 glutamate receptor 3.3 isoform X1 [Cryptomeria japonica]
MWNLVYCQCYLVVLLLVFSVWIPCNCTVAGKNASLFGNARPLVVNVGALFAFDSTIGRVAKTAMELAVKNVNSDYSLLGGTKLELSMMNSNCSAFTGTAAALELLKKDVVAIIGPQLSVLAHIVSHLAKELQIPLLSFAATDPTLTSYEYPYFIRMAHSDFSQMSAIAAVVGNYGWREVVVVYIDDDYGRNGVSILGDALGNLRAKITNKAAMPPGISQSEMGNILAKLALEEARVFVVHMNSDAGLNLFSKAKDIGMLSSGYVWIVTDWLSSVLDSTVLATDDMNSLQGVIGLRRQNPNSEKRNEFTRVWKRLQTTHMVHSSLNVFGLYAYDSILMIAHSINAFLNQGGNFSFVEQNTLSNKSGSNSELAALKVFEGGAQLRKIILETNFTGVAGPVQLDKYRDLMGSTFEIINIAGTGFRSIGYWSDHTGLSVTLPEYSATINHNQSHVKPKLHDIIWPGESKVVPRGWAFPNNGKELVIGVPRKIGFKEFVTTVNDSHTPKGFCIDVFVAAVNLLPYAVPYTFISYGTGNSTPSYDKLVEQVAFKNFDAAVGDISIVTKRSKIVDFTQPYVESGLVVVVPVKEIDSNAWAFLRPFTVQMWCTTGAFFLVIGSVVWILEHKSNPEFRGHPKQQIMNVLWFAFSTMFFSHRENTVSSLGRAVLIIWLFVVLIINSSYTASLTSILTVEQLSPTIQGIDSLASSNLPIGYQSGSFVADYLSGEFNIAKYRLVPLNTRDSYAEALSLGPKKGGVAAVVDELPYIESFLSTRCGYTIVGSEFTKSGWGFVFPKDSQLAVDMSTAILDLSESGELQRIHDKWLKNDICSLEARAVHSNKFGLESFWGLFLVTGIVCFVSLFVFFFRMIFQFTRYADAYNEESPGKSHSLSLRSAKVLRSFASFVDEREDNEKIRRLKRKRAFKKMDPEFELSQTQSRPI